jgi:hypothetical protein
MEHAEAGTMTNESAHVNITFGVRGASLVPQEFTALLGIEPSHAFAKGDECVSGKEIRRRPWGVWQLRSEFFICSRNLEDHANFILKKLEPKRDLLTKYLTSDDMYVDIRIWLESDSEIVSFAVNSRLFARLAGLCQEFNFSIITRGAERDQA